MRNPDRIEVIVDKFQELWEKYPDLRFCQLVGNLTADVNSVYDLEDDEFERRLDKYEEWLKSGGEGGYRNRKSFKEILEEEEDS